ncbi:hypothetical protein HNY73_008640 [Argiope bruennichi]|uniref:Uncharacterized protein n=1 Tax=Argiope bruennichi TaxID=94029 RepID=A0A8T0F823_ARGBR|nr:hypothetical protein HNY73_008640 [Argiope bruennichi]
MSNFNNDSSQRDSRKRWTPKPKRGSQRLQDESTRLALALMGDGRGERETLLHAGVSPGKITQQVQILTGTVCCFLTAVCCVVYFRRIVCSFSKMDGPEVLKKQRPRKVTRRKSTISRSNVLKFIVSCLEMELYSHMLYWADREKDMRLLVKICGNE